VAAVVAAAAALVALRYAGQTVSYARETVLKAEAAMSEVAVQHSEQMEAMTALTDAMRAATAATAKRAQTETQRSQVAQVQRIAELALETKEAAEAEAERARSGALSRLPSRLSVMLKRLETARNAWSATADPDENRNPLATAILELQPWSMDQNDPDDVADKCAVALTAINNKWAVATAKHLEHETEQMRPEWKLRWEVDGNPQGLCGYLLRLLASQGPKTEADLMAAVRVVSSYEQKIPGWVANASEDGLIESNVPHGGVGKRWQITNAGREVSGIPTNPAD